MGKKDKITAKKFPFSVASVNSSNSLLMQNLKTVNACLMKEVAESQKEIERIRIQLVSLVDEKEIFYSIQRDVSAFVLSYSLRESASRATTEITAASNREKILRKKIEAVAREANTKEIELLALAKENDEKEKELAELKESIASMEQANERGKRRRNLFCSVVVSTPFMVVAGAAAFAAFCVVFKK